MRTAYQVTRGPGFSAALAKVSPRLDPTYLRGVTWTLERDPHLGIRVTANVRIIKELWAPLVATIYYTIDETKHVVTLLDVTV